MRPAGFVTMLLSLGLCAAAPAWAQPPGPAGTAAAPTDATRPPEAPAPAPAPSGDEENLFRFYGTFNPRLIVSNGAVESFNQPNAVAITAAGNPVLSNLPDAARFSLQVAQSRAGFWLNEQGQIRAQLEVDFVDFTKATPTVASLPRLRIARVDYVPRPGHTLSLGQDWDLHAPINPHGINMVASLFQAGNAAFMRQQIRYLYATPSLELGAAVGFPAANVTAKDAALELGLTPTLAVRAAYKSGKSRVGASALATRLLFNPGTDEERFRAAFSVALFGEWAPSAQTNVRVELNAGQNGANLGLLTLAQGRAGQDVREVGGFISARQVLTERQAIYALAGYEKVLDPSTVVPSYNYPIPIAATATLAGTGPGLLHNGTARVGYEFRPGRKLAFIVEGFLLRSRFRLQDEDAARVDSLRAALGLETGAQLSF
jgi:hypothetical protein